MSTENIPDFPSERLLEQAQGNFNAIVCTTIAYLKERGLPLDDYVNYVGQKLAPSWDSTQAASARDTAENAALNLVASGGQVLALTGNEQQAEVLVTNSPPPDFLEMAGISAADADAFNGVFHVIAGTLGLRFEQQRTDNQVRLRFSR
jgi:CubicO group peptidase (beta-lactamase class C family)